MIRYDELKEIAKKVRADLTEKEIIDPSNPKVRKKPRDDEKAALIYMQAVNRLKKYPPKITPSNRIRLPYFK
ncbi:MAG: hypothetical protein HY957_03455 [Nitrospirae bacterium]|nr:hypothetical protein [Nitrospirota bacterium]